MNGPKKLQVFVSSTYEDLKDARQAAVEAILSCGHIPAGMELFTAGDESQMDVIKRWIRESDVFLLVLGGRYGSIEPKAGKSYIELEYRYALESGKPLFALVIDEKTLEERVKRHGSAVIEKQDPQSLRSFRELVLSRLVKFWSDLKDIKLAIHETLADFSRREDIIGWVRGDAPSNSVTLAEEVARLAKENESLRSQHISRETDTYLGLPFDQLVALMEKELIPIDDPTSLKAWESLMVANSEGNNVQLLVVFSALRLRLVEGFVPDNQTSKTAMRYCCLRGLVDSRIKKAELGSFGTIHTGIEYKLTDEGKRFINRLDYRDGKISGDR